jgi:hypothetical protein
MDVGKEFDELQEHVATVDVLADREFQPEFHVFVGIVTSFKDVFHAFDVVEPAVDLELEPKIGESCFVDVRLDLGAHLGTEL